MSTSILWLRRDLRVHDHPGLVAALTDSDLVLPVFVLDSAVYQGRWASADRTHSLLTALSELRSEFEAIGGRLVLRQGDPERVLVQLAEQVGASTVHATSDAAPFALERDARVGEALENAGVSFERHPGTYCADISKILTQQEKPYAVFSPFWRNWAEQPRRTVLPAPKAMHSPEIEDGAIPSVEELGLTRLLTDPLAAGERAARSQTKAWLSGGVDSYVEDRNQLAKPSSMLSHHLHLGSLSALELEARAATVPGPGSAAFRRQLAWRDFYAHVMLFSPRNVREPFQKRFANLEWLEDQAGWQAWCEGQTGFPLVDAGMRELASTGFMHNRVRMVVASFLTKDLHIDYRQGEQWFMRLLLDGDTTQNNGNWQWVASLGVDPQPYFKRIFNPVLQQKKFDSDGAYVRHWVPELSAVPDRCLPEPWLMSVEEQQASGCLIGSDYPAPILDHKAERLRAVERYRSVADADS